MCYLLFEQKRSEIIFAKIEKQHRQKTEKIYIQ